MKAYKRVIVKSAPITERYWEVGCNGQIDEDKQEILNTYINRKYDPEATNGCVPTKLFPLRSKTDFVNSMMFKRLDEKEYVSEAIRQTDCMTNMDSTKPLSFEVIQKCKALSENEIKYENNNYRWRNGWLVNWFIF